MSEVFLQDQAARDAIQHDLARNMVVLAGAGAGKTHALVGRMVQAVTTGHVEVQHMAAITFTRKAAGELRGRFYGRLREAAANAAGDEAVRIGRALDAFDQCFMGTIHAFCGRLLRERPVEAGLAPDFTEIEDREETVLRRDLWDRFVQQCALADDRRLKELDDLGLRAEDLYPFFKERCRFNDLPLKEPRVDMPDLTPVLDRAYVLLDDALAHVPDELPKGRDGFMEVLEKARRFLDYRGVDTPADQVHLLRMLDKTPDIKVTYWGPEKAYASKLLKEDVPVFQTEMLTPALTRWRQYAYRHAAVFVDDAMAYYDRERRRAATLTFQDLLLKATALLRDYPVIRRFFQQRYRCLFIDEFQDTDPIQAEMAFYLTGTDTEETDWRRLVPRPGSLFVVGDDKQSIYRFRRADVETFRFVTERIQAAGGDALHLSTSFRALGGLCDWINHTFADLGRAQYPEYQALFVPLLKHRPQGPGAGCVRKLTVDQITRHPRAEIAAVGASRIAEFIAAAVAGRTGQNGSADDAPLGPCASPGDFLILTRTRSQLPVYARALEERGIPFDIVGGGRLGDNVGVQALTDMLEAVVMPDNPIPMICYLRGPFVGLGDDELYAYHACGGRFNHRHDLPAGLSAPTHRHLDDAFNRLRRVSGWMTTKPPAAAFELLLEDLGLVPFSAAGDAGSTHAGSLLRVLALVRVWENEGMHGERIVAELRDLIEDGEYEVEEMTLEAGRGNVVRLMNLHQAKGLEGRVVFLCDPYDTSGDRHGVDSHVSRAGATPYLALPVYRPRGPYQKEIVAEPEGWEQDAATEEQFLEAENLRLLYVAATRARNLLVVSCYPGTPGKGPWAPFYPYLEDVPELEGCMAPPATQREEPTPDWDRLRHGREKRWKGIKQPTYALGTVTGDLPVDELTPARGRGKGREYGTLAHRLFQAAVTDRLPADEEAFIRSLAEESGLGEERVAEARRVLSAFRDSQIWAEVGRSDRVYTEVPFAVSGGETDMPEVLRGVIDLVYRVHGGWKIVDYKTDGIGDTETVEALVRKYGPQIDAYAQQWSQLTGEPVVEKGLWLAEIDVYRQIHGA